MKKQFRNHPSIIIENIGATGLVILGVAFTNIRYLLDLISEIGRSELSFYQILSAVIVILVALLLLGMQIIRWKKTTISYDDKSIEISRNTLNKTEKTYAIRNISNINLEQNIFEQIFGTCKLKIDTNTAITAEETDIKIVLDKKFAEDFKREILRVSKSSAQKENKAGSDVLDMRSSNMGDRGNIYDENQIEDEVIAEIIYTKAEINKHFIFSNFTSIIIAFAFFIGNIWSAVISDGINFALLLIIIPFIWGLIKDYQKYHNMKIKRIKDKVIIQSGLTTKNQYEIPIKKISGIKIKQNIIARLFNLYMVEIINIGMGDTKDETSVFLLIQNHDKLQANLDKVLSEFSLDIIAEAQYQSEKSSFALNVILAIKLAVSSLLAYVILFYLPAKTYEFPRFVNIILISIFFLYLADIILVRVLSMKTNAIALRDDRIMIMHGRIARTIVIIDRDKIQQIKVKNGPLSRKHNLFHGHIIILSNLMNRDISLGYFDKNFIEEII